MDQTEGNGEPGLARHILGCTTNELIDVQIANAQVCKAAEGAAPPPPPVRGSTIRQPDPS
ncbi:hypothetical protein [Streptomyces sp. NPDC005407]|uniref:hypothetical protein n=1 Tax=Streptomyces sp. NPDC005407 TaxID=3155340 RepID=UPI0033A554FD